MSNSDNSCKEYVYDITKERHALELRAEVINLVAGRKAERKGLSDRLEIGIESATDTAYGKEELHVGGGLTEEAHNGETTGEMLSTTVYGKLNLNYYSDTLITAGGMLEQYTEGEFIAAGMSDNLLGAGGVRIHGADLCLNTVSTVEEKVITLAIDGLVAECCSTACEQEGGSAIYKVRFTSYKGTMEVLTGTTFRPMCRALFGVRTKNRGGGGGGDSNELSSEQSPPAADSPEPLQPTNSLLPPGSPSDTTTSLVKNAEHFDQMEDVLIYTDNAIHTNQAVVDKLKIILAERDIVAAKNVIEDSNLRCIRTSYIISLDDFISKKKKELISINKTKITIESKKNIKKIKSSINTVRKVRKAIVKEGNAVDNFNKLKAKYFKNNNNFSTFRYAEDKLVDSIMYEIKSKILVLNKKISSNSNISYNPKNFLKHNLDKIDELESVNEIRNTENITAELANFYKKTIDNILIDNNKEIIKTTDDLNDARNYTGNFKENNYDRGGFIEAITKHQQSFLLEQHVTNELKQLTSAAEDPISTLDRLYEIEVKRIGQIPEGNIDFTRRDMYRTIQDKLIEARNKDYTPSAVNNNNLPEIRPTPKYTDRLTNAYGSDAKDILEQVDETTKAQGAGGAIRQTGNSDNTVMGSNSNFAPKSITNSPDKIYPVPNFSQNSTSGSIQSNPPEIGYSDIDHNIMPAKDRGNNWSGRRKAGSGHSSFKDFIRRKLGISPKQVKIKETVSATDDVPSSSIVQLPADEPSTINTFLGEETVAWKVQPDPENVNPPPSHSHIEQRSTRPRSSSSFHGPGEFVSDESFNTFNLIEATDRFSNKNDSFSKLDSLSKIGRENPSGSVVSNTGSFQTLTGSPLGETGRSVQNAGSPQVKTVPTNKKKTFTEIMGHVVTPDTASTSPVKHQDLPSNPLPIDNTQIDKNIVSFESTRNNELVRVNVSDINTSLTENSKQPSSMLNKEQNSQEIIEELDDLKPQRRIFSINKVIQSDASRLHLKPVKKLTRLIVLLKTKELGTIDEQ